ncbi:protein PHLOEM PROTEIN 2-LIKE A1-like isoform X2 [Papaver somniferum]|uniref:protein PHLOEM PROTEIN 2-LIKE A1-like isoform X2 n=1 Tax=Papaver somniferum TaxID=3469 RepID=UPI000E6F9182|nr:protein PHLOEM PROTEIN 2-LIKE A1-like isoform X2 [Papaver somniferum]
MGGRASISDTAHQRPASCKLAAPLPHNYECIIQDADMMNINQSELHHHLSSGIFLNQKKQKYWIDNSGYNCFMLFPRDLAITWAEDKQYWQWSSMKESSTSCEMAIEVAELLNVCWLEVNGKLDISKLNPGVKYEVVFVVMLKNSAYGWEKPVNLRLVHSGSQTQLRKEDLQKKPKSQWIEVQIGEFQTPPQPADDKQGKEIQFSLFECENQNWKRGLVIKS